MNLLAFKDQKVTLTAIFLNAVELNDESTITHCIQRGVDTNATFFDKITALHVAAEEGNSALAKILLAVSTTKVDLKSHHGWTPLMMATHIGNLKIMRMLLKHGANTYTTDNLQRIPLHMAILMRNIRAAILLLKYTEYLDCRDCMGATPLYYSTVLYPSSIITKLLLRNGANPRVVTAGNMGILFELALHGLTAKHVITMRTILKCPDLDINQRDPVGMKTPLHLTAITNFIPMAELLLDMGASRHMVDIKKRRPVDLARIFENKEITTFLETYVPQREITTTKKIKKITFLSEEKLSD